LNARPSTTLITSSTLLGEKNQKYPVSEVSATPVPTPLVPCAGTCQLTRTWKRPLFKHRVRESATHGPEAASGTATADGAASPPVWGPLPIARSERAASARTLRIALMELTDSDHRPARGGAAGS